MKKPAFLLLFLMAAPVFLPADSGTVLCRMALFVGVNNGGPDRKSLKYAVSDASSVSRVFGEMGGIARADRVLLVEPEREKLVEELEKIKKRALEQKGRCGRLEFIFYYSGHADEDGLLLGDGKYAFKELKETVKGIVTDLNIVIVDSCSSGSMTRIKGGKKQPPFLVDSGMNIKGYAILTSSSSEEVSQESDRIGASFFTHYLVSGLRGAADTSGDGRVTLNEAYQYTYQETLARTEKTMKGPQHPNYDIQITGSGEVIMTDVKENSAGLILPASSRGKYFIRGDREQLVAEINKEKGRSVEIGLEPGRYTIAVERDRAYYRGEVRLQKGAFLKVDEESLRKEKREETASRGREAHTAQKEQTLFQKSFREYHHGGFGGPALKIMRFAGAGRILAGGRGAWILEHKLCLGGGGYGMLSGIERVWDSTNRAFRMGYGGVEVGWVHRSDSLLHLYSSLLIGAGAMSYMNADEAEEDSGGDFFMEKNPTTSVLFALEPRVYGELNVTRWFRICAGAGLHYFQFVKGRRYYTPGEMSGFSVELLLKFGRF